MLIRRRSLLCTDLYFHSLQFCEAFTDCCVTVDCVFQMLCAMVCCCVCCEEVFHWLVPLNDLEWVGVLSVFWLKNILLRQMAYFYFIYFNFFTARHHSWKTDIFLFEGNAYRRMTNRFNDQSKVNHLTFSKGPLYLKTRLGAFLCLFWTSKQNFKHIH